MAFSVAINCLALFLGRKVGALKLRDSTTALSRLQKNAALVFLSFPQIWTMLIGCQCFLLLVFEMTTYMFVREEEEEDCEDCDCEDCEDEE